ncbi:MAG: ribosome biogenesis GTPase Der [Pirellulales bacterium]
MPLPQVAIVGRPNVGKSSLFNWLAGRRLAIVEDHPGVTRDRQSHMIEHGDRYFELIDTGGIGIVDVDDLTDQIDAQIQAAIESADVLVHVVDVKSGLASLDAQVAERLRPAGVPVILVANKTDAAVHEPLAAEFFRLGVGEPLCTSTKQNRGREDLLEAIVKRLPESADGAPTESTMKLAIVGKRNVGKSTFVNTLAESERMIVSEVPGTTRDSVDVRFEIDGQAFTAIDTPGVKRAAKLTGDLEFYSLHRAQRSIRRADVVLLFFDSSEMISRVDKQLCEYIEEQFKPCIFVINKWDLHAGKVSTEGWVEHIREQLPRMDHVPIVFITGQTGKNVKALINHAQMLFKQARERVSTADLNKVVEWALEQNPPPLFQNRRPKVYYATQVTEQPPTIVLFCNEPHAISKSYRRYLLRVFRDELPFPEVPIRLFLRSREHRDERDAKASERGRK